MKRDTKAITLVLEWLEENNPFDLDHDKKLLVFFSTRFTSTADDAVNAKRATEVEGEMQIISNIYHAGKVQGTGPFITQKDSQG